MTRDELLSSREYWITKIQLDLYKEIETFMSENNLTRTQLAERLGVTKGYISQVLNGDFDHRISKLVDLALSIGKAPQLEYSDLRELISKENRVYSTNWFAFTEVIRGDQLQYWPYQDNTEDHSNGADIMTA